MKTLFKDDAANKMIFDIESIASQKLKFSHQPKCLHFDE